MNNCTLLKAWGGAGQMPLVYSRLRVGRYVVATLIRML
ncbi:hypothetical protein SBA6_680031 [Candidatus Sulfopaludibacter sp. SbA6]|nr:hypothetical protein SBA6_680031 [Candidatus Sulfopaludibacter sp. SbA6]